MTIRGEDELAGILRIGSICGRVRDQMLGRIEPGMTTAELDAIGREQLDRAGARSAPRLAYDFPGDTCISVNEEAAHGIPGSRVLQPGDVVNVDVSAELNGFWADTGATALVPPAAAEHTRLCRSTRRALTHAIRSATAGAPIRAIGKAVEKVAKKAGFSIIRELCGHGVGRAIHEEPQVLNYHQPGLQGLLHDGLVIAVEPFLSTGRGMIETAPDGWTLRETPGAVNAQYEHTLVITQGKPIVATA
jgi:methionyl aminopeptidase